MKNKIREIILQALREDVGGGDITTLATIPQSQILYGEFLAKDSGVVSGLAVAKQVFDIINNKIEFKIHINDGSPIKKVKY